MTRRLTLVIALVVFAAVTISTALTLLTGAARARASTELEASRTATQLARRVSAAAARDRLPAVCGLGAITEAFRVESVGCVTVAADGRVRLLGDGGSPSTTGLPAALPSTLGAVELRRLTDGEAVTGARARRVWALAPAEVGSAARRGTPAVVVVRRVENPLSALGLRWLAISALLTVGAGLLAAWWLGRRLAAPLRRATAATHELADGRLDVRLPVDERAAPGDELVDLSRSINALGESLQRSRGLEQRFLLSVSHDLRTPLTSIRGYADALADGTMTDVAKGASVIQRESVRLERLVRDLLDLAKLDARSFRLDLRPVQLGAVAAALVDALAHDAADRGLTLRRAAPPGPAGDVTVLADPDRAAQVVANLVENALKYAATTVVLDAGIDPDDERFGRLRVTDDGPGIAAEDLPHVFERLYVSARVPARKEAGSGLGLAIVKELVEAMGGRVAVTGAVPHGTSFSVWLPRAAPVTGPPAPPLNPPAAPPPPR